MKRHIVKVAGVAALLIQLGINPAHCAEQAQAAGGASAVTELIRLLEAKGVISGDEARQFEKKFAPPVAKAEEPKGAESWSPERKEEGKAAVQISFQDVITALDFLTDQGVISQPEKGELKARTDDLILASRGKTLQKRESAAVGTGEIEYRRTTLPVDDVQEKLRFLAFQNVLTRKEETGILERFGRKNQTDKIVENIITEVNGDVQKQVDQKMQTVARLEGKASKLPEWLERFRLYGDLRLRYEADYFGSDNAFPVFKIDKPTEIMNTTNDRTRFRIRARLGITAKVNDQVDATIGLATGNTTDPVSTNATLGDSLNKKGINVDTAYLKWTPCKSLTFTGGRMPNPWFSTDLVWDRDLNFDGIAATYAPRLTDSLGVFLTGGVFPLQEIEFAQHDKWLFGGQAGINYQLNDNVVAKVGAAYYYFANTKGRPNDDIGTFDYTAPIFVQKGNTYFDINNGLIDPVTLKSLPVKNALAADYHLLNFTGSVDLGFFHPFHVMLMGDYVVNVGYDSKEVNQLLAPQGGQVDKENYGYQLGIALGHADVSKFGDWRGFFTYRYLKADAVMDAFTDSDFHLGGTNAKGWILGGDIGLHKNVWLNGKWMTANEISGEKSRIDTFYIDLNAKF